MANAYVDNDDNVEAPTERFLDLAREPDRDLGPIKNYEKVPLVSLDEAVKPIEHLIDNVAGDIWTARRNCKKLLDSLSIDERAAIYVYTMESLYRQLNKALRSKDRKRLIPWFSYLKLFLTALWKLPDERRTIWRGIKADISEQYNEGEPFVWWGFSSCTTSLKQAEQFLGKTGARTLFNIEPMHGKLIQNHSHLPAECEVLLLPCSYFEVLGCIDQGNGLHIIHIRQTEPPVPLISPPFDTSAADNQVSQGSTTTTVSEGHKKTSSKSTGTYNCLRCDAGSLIVLMNIFILKITDYINENVVSFSVGTFTEAAAHVTNRLSKIDPFVFSSTGTSSVVTTSYLSPLKEKPRLRLNIHAERFTMEANDKYLVYCAASALCVIDRDGREKLNVQHEFIRIYDICWSSLLKRFLIIGYGSIYSLDIAKAETQLMKTFDWSVFRCACNDDTFFLYEDDMKCIQEYNLSSNWKLMKTFKPPVSCAREETIYAMKFNSDGSRLGVIIRRPVEEDNSSCYFFELRNPYDNMRVLKTIDFGKSTYGLLALPKQQFLVNAAMDKKLYLIDSNGHLKESIEYDAEVIGSTALINENCLVLQTNCDLLRFYDL